VTVQKKKPHFMKILMGLGLPWVYGLCFSNNSSIVFLPSPVLYELCTIIKRRDRVIIIHYLLDTFISC